MAVSNGGVNLMGAGAGDPDMWDDRELIRAYDKSVKNWRRNQNEEGAAAVVEETPGPGPWREVAEDNQSSTTVSKPEPSAMLSSEDLLEIGSWVIGAPCRALYSEDGVEYEAKIIGIEGPKCTVRFVGYGNEEQVNLQDLRTTHGKQSRAKQRRAAFEYQQNISAATGSSNVEEITDRVSNISMSSSMYNNCTESVCRDGDLEDTLTDGRPPIQTSTPRSILFGAIPKQTSNSLAKLRMAKSGSLPSHSIDTVESAMPSCAEATIDSSSDVSSIAEEPQQTENMANGDWENFNNTMPQFRFPVPPMPLSLSNKDGGFDFGRGELPSLLMSWYMAGYQAGFFDAKQEVAAANRNRDERMDSSKSPKRLG